MQHANLMLRLYHSYLRAAGLGWVFDDDRYKSAPALSDERREELRDIMFEKAQEKTLDEWMELYVADGDVAPSRTSTPLKACDIRSSCTIDMPLRSTILASER